MFSFPSNLLHQATEILNEARNCGLRITAAESCTGGLVAALLTEIAGSSDVFDRGFVTYSNDAKTSMLGVPKNTILTYGAVSKETALAMAEGALNHSLSQISIAITGIAGPSGGTQDKPVGTVHFVCADTSGQRTHFEALFTGDRHNIRMAAVNQALTMLQAALGS